MTSAVTKQSWRRFVRESLGVAFAGAGLMIFGATMSAFWPGSNPLLQLAVIAVGFGALAVGTYSGLR